MAVHAHLPEGKQEVGAEEMLAIDIALQALGGRAGIQIARVLLPALLHGRHRSLHHAMQSYENQHGWQYCFDGIQTSCNDFRRFPLYVRHPQGRLAAPQKKPVIGFPGSSNIQEGILPAVKPAGSNSAKGQLNIAIYPDEDATQPKQDPTMQHCN